MQSRRIAAATAALLVSATTAYAAPVVLPYSLTHRVEIAYAARIDTIDCFAPGTCSTNLIGTFATGGFIYDVSDRTSNNGKISLSLSYAPLIPPANYQWYDGALDIYGGSLTRLTAELFSTLGPSGGVGINNSGEFVLATGFQFSGAACPSGCILRGTVLAVSAIPEPPTLALLLSGFLGVWGFVRREKS